MRDVQCLSRLINTPPRRPHSFSIRLCLHTTSWFENYHLAVSSQDRGTPTDLQHLLLNHHHFLPSALDCLSPKAASSRRKPFLPSSRLPLLRRALQAQSGRVPPPGFRNDLTGSSHLHPLHTPCLHMSSPRYPPRLVLGLHSSSCPHSPRYAHLIPNVEFYQAPDLFVDSTPSSWRDFIPPSNASR